MDRSSGTPVKSPMGAAATAREAGSSTTESPFIPVTQAHGHHESISAIETSPLSGQAIATGDTEAGIRLWRVGRTTPLATLKGGKRAVSRLRFSPDELRIMSGDDGGAIHCFDLTKMERTAQLRGHAAAVLDARWHPMNPTILGTGGSDNLVRMSDTRSAREFISYKGHTAPVQCVLFSPDGRWIASGSQDGELRVWDLTAGRCIAYSKEHTEAIVSLDFHPKELALLSASLDKTVCLWSMAPFVPKLRSDPLAAPPCNAQFVAGGEAAIVVGRRFVRVLGMRGEDGVSSTGQGVSAQDLTETDLPRPAFLATSSCTSSSPPQPSSSSSGTSSTDSHVTTLQSLPVPWRCEPMSVWLGKDARRTRPAGRDMGTMSVDGDGNGNGKGKGVKSKGLFGCMVTGTPQKGYFRSWLADCRGLVPFVNIPRSRSFGLRSRSDSDHAEKEGVSIALAEDSEITDGKALKVDGQGQGQGSLVAPAASLSRPPPPQSSPARAETARASSPLVSPARRQPARTSSPLRADPVISSPARALRLQSGSRSRAGHGSDEGTNEVPVHGEDLQGHRDSHGHTSYPDPAGLTTDAAQHGQDADEVSSRAEHQFDSDIIAESNFEVDIVGPACAFNEALEFVSSQRHSTIGLRPGDFLPRPGSAALGATLGRGNPKLRQSLASLRGLGVAGAGARRRRHRDRVVRSGSRSVHASAAGSAGSDAAAKDQRPPWRSVLDDSSAQDGTGEGKTDDGDVKPAKLLGLTGQLDSFSFPGVKPLAARVGALIPGGSSMAGHESTALRSVLQERLSHVKEAAAHWKAGNVTEAWQAATSQGDIALATDFIDHVRLGSGGASLEALVRVLAVAKGAFEDGVPRFVQSSVKCARRLLSAFAPLIADCLAGDSAAELEGGRDLSGARRVRIAARAVRRAATLRPALVMAAQRGVVPGAGRRDGDRPQSARRSLPRESIAECKRALAVLDAQPWWGGQSAGSLKADVASFVAEQLDD